MNWQDTIIAEYDKIIQYRNIGLRGLQADENYGVGDVARNSFDWDFENDCSSSDELDGTCAIMVKTWECEDAEELIMEIKEMLEFAQEYGDGRIVLLGGYHAKQGDDGAERIISDAVVLALIK